MGNLLDIEVAEYGTTIQEVELDCAMTGFRLRLLVEHPGDGCYRSSAVFL